MALTALLPLLAFLLLCLVWAGQREAEPDGLAGILRAAVLWGALLAALTEGLSLLGSVNRLGLALGWTVVLAGLGLYGWWGGRLRRGWGRVRGGLDGLRRIPRAEAVILAAVGVLALALLAVALMAPPNTNDSMRYHLARVMHWQQNQSLAHYPTPIEAQLWMPPWAELAILHLVVLEGSDRLANLVQWLAMVGSLVGVAWLARRLGARAAGQVFAVLFAFTIPMGILQSTSTQNDTVTAFWAVCLAVFVLQDLDGQPSAWWMGLALGLGVLTKGTFYPYAAALMLAWLAGKLLELRGGAQLAGWLRGLAGTAAVLLVCAAALNGGFWIRNGQAFDSPLGPAGSVRSLANGSFTPGAVTSNLVRNLTLHLGTPYGIINGNVQRAVEALHDWMGQAVDDPATTLDAYRIKRYLTEDRAGNPWHLLALPLIALLSWVLAWKTPLLRLARRRQARTSREVRLYGAAVAAAFLLFAVLYKWQSTGSRLQLAWFVLLAPLVGLVWERLEKAWLRYGIVAFFLIAALPHIFTNPSRPLLPFRGDPQTLWNTPRQVLYFRNFPEVQAGYQSLAAALEQTGCRQVGLHLDSSDPEYYLWALTADLEPPVRFEHLLEARPVAGFVPCAVICTRCTAEVLDGLPLHSVHPGGLRLYAP
jgi:hypothetical protein